MRKLFYSALCFSFLLFTACESTHQEGYVRLPTSTPFDANPLERSAYLDGYEQGYRNVFRYGWTPLHTKGPYQFARDLGWRAGASDAYQQSVSVSVQK